MDTKEEKKQEENKNKGNRTKETHSYQTKDGSIYNYLHAPWLNDNKP